MQPDGNSRTRDRGRSRRSLQRGVKAALCVPASGRGLFEAFRDPDLDDRLPSHAEPLGFPI